MLPVLAESYLHDLNPFAIQFTESFGIRWYGLAYAVGFLIGWSMISWLARTGRSPLTPRLVGDFMTYVIVGVLVGGRLGYALFYDPHLIIGFSGTIPFWDLLAINKGGMASHGGVIGSVLACCLFGYRRRTSILHLFDLCAWACTPGLGLGRIANFVNGELWGRPLPADGQLDPPWWSIKYPEQILSPEFLHRDALEALCPIVGGDQTFLANLVEAMQAGNQEVIEVVRPLLTAYYPSQLLQALTDGPILLAVLALIWLKPRKPGIIAAWFLIAYGVLRIATEFFRAPDEGIGLVLGLSRGQWLSTVMVIAGALLLAVSARRTAPRYGGLVWVERESGTGSSPSSAP